MNKQIKDEPFNIGMLKMLSVLHFNMFEEKYDLKQKTCNLLGIPFKNKALKPRK